MHFKQLFCFSNLIRSAVHPSLPEWGISQVFRINKYHSTAGNSSWGSILQISNLCGYFSYIKLSLRQNPGNCILLTEILKFRQTSNSRAQWFCKRILSPLARVRSLLSSITEFIFSTHRASTSPSNRMYLFVKEQVIYRNDSLLS